MLLYFVPNPKRNSFVATIVALISFMYCVIAIVKGIYQWTEGSSFGLAVNINHATLKLFQATNFFPLNLAWEKIPAIPFEGNDIISFYKVIIPPLVVILICIFFIADHRRFKTKYSELKDEIAKEISLRDMRKEAGMHAAPENATVDVIISNATNTDPSWHDTWWGRIVIGLSIVLIATAIGLK